MWTRVRHRYGLLPVVAAFALLLGLVVLRVIVGAEPPGPPLGSFLVDVDDVYRDDDTRVTRVVLDVTPPATIRVVADRPNSGGMTLAVTDGARRPVRLTILADRVHQKAGECDTLKFLVRSEAGGGTTTSSRVGPMPAGKTVDKLLSVPIRSGSYRVNEPVELYRFDGLTYRLVVEPGEGRGVSGPK